MQLSNLDWIIIGVYFVAVVLIGVAVAKISGKNAWNFFLGGREMPWWLLGVSMVATTFSTDTPNLVTDIVRQNGVAGNWVWWAFLITGMVTVFLYAKLWRRTDVITDIAFYEVRYTGKSAAFLRGFRALYLGVFFNIMIMASVTLAAIKIGGVMLGLSPLQCILLAAVVTVVFSTLGGFRGVVFTDFMLFIVAMIGSIAAAYFALGHAEIGSLKALLEHPNLEGKTGFLPRVETNADSGLTDANLDLWMTLMIMPLVIQWWSVGYPGAEPGGGGYIAQRMLAAENEQHATGAILFFNFVHYGLRPWPWIIVALASLVVFPTLESIRVAFPEVDPSVIGHDMAYPAMLTFLPSGWLGLVLASLAAAYMSTISTHLNWGSSYVANDFYKRFVKPKASGKELVLVGRISTAVMMILAGILALNLKSALDTFQILLQVGAGTGLLFMLRWYWWRINAFSELAAMIASFVIAVLFKVVDPGWAWWVELITGVGLTTVTWIVVTLVTPPSDMKSLLAFYKRVQPGGKGWGPVRELSPEFLPQPESMWPQIGQALSGIICIYGFLFGIGKLVYGEYLFGIILLVVAIGIAVKLVTSKSLVGRS
ncbi:MAG: sodium:solute symporter family protein [Verrucomicrobiota bacterium]|nr:sodium:solute symporter family protein [Verrucomicrobiota bacterium]